MTCARWAVVLLFVAAYVSCIHHAAAQQTPAGSTWLAFRVCPSSCDRKGGSLHSFFFVQLAWHLRRADGGWGLPIGQLPHAASCRRTSANRSPCATQPLLVVAGQPAAEGNPVVTCEVYFDEVEVRGNGFCTCAHACPAVSFYPPLGGFGQQARPYLLPFAAPAEGLQFFPERRL
jgi:hypothetical protein